MGRHERPSQGYEHKQGDDREPNACAPETQGIAQ
jgi:hypothetical protein